MSKKLDINNIRERIIKIHGDKYILPDQKYVDSFSKILVICKNHGEFHIQPRHLLSGHGCIKCDGFEKLTLDKLRKKCYDINGDNIFIPDQEYINSKTKINVKCKLHPNYNWDVLPYNLLRHKGCPVCNKRQRLNINDVINKCNLVHKDKGYIILEQPYINNETHIKVICPKHGEWKIKPNNLFNGCGCPKCKTSKGELQIENILKFKNIKYISQKKFKGCINKKSLIYDFYLPDYNICIEFDGEQHFKPFRFEKDNKRLQQTINNDIIKNEYCKNNNINLIRIKYNEDIDKKMNEIFNIY